MRANWVGLIILMVVAGGALSCHRSIKKETSAPPSMSSAAIATVAGEEISEEMLVSELRRRFGAGSADGVTAEQKLEALERLIQQEAIYAQARASGFDQSPDVQARIKNLVVAQFRERHARSNQSPSVTEAEIQSVYETQKERFQVPEAVRGAVIFVEAPRTATPEKRAELRQRAEAVWAEARAAADDRAFAQVVARHSEDRSTRYRGGDIGWVARDGANCDAVLADALLKLAKPGDFAPLVETARGFYVAKLIEKHKAGRKPVGEVRDALIFQISRQKAEQAERDFHSAMRKGLDVQINRAALNSISRPAPPNEPPALPATSTARLQ
jgi:parvulin-like peptidyl-prolyl isomerase